MGYSAPTFPLQFCGHSGNMCCVTPSFKKQKKEDPHNYQLGCSFPFESLRLENFLGRDEGNMLHAWKGKILIIWISRKHLQMKEEKEG